MMSRIRLVLVATLIVSLTGFAVGTFTYAMLSDTETVGGSISAGTWDTTDTTNTSTSTDIIIAADSTGANGTVDPNSTGANGTADPNSTGTNGTVAPNVTGTIPPNFTGANGPVDSNGTNGGDTNSSTPDNRGMNQTKLLMSTVRQSPTATEDSS